MGFQFKKSTSTNMNNRSSVGGYCWQRIRKPRSVLGSNSENGSGDISHSVSEDTVEEEIDWNAEMDSSPSFKLNKKKLFPEEIQKFKQMGKPDLSQNFLELFSPELVDDLFTIMDYSSDNYKKADFMLKELKPYGFYEIGEGTNILVVGNSRYPGVVFKIALDHNGIADNFNDELLQRVVPHYTRVFARHSTGIVSVQEYSVTMTQERMTQFYSQVIRLLEKLSKTYLIADLSPSRFLNFGINRQGDFVIQDGSDLYPLSQLVHKFRCKNPCGWNAKKREMLLCGGKLEYSADFLVLRCKKCGHEINPLELRPNEKEEKAQMANIMHDGLSQYARDEMEAEELKHFGVSSAVTVSDDVIIQKGTDSEPVPSEQAEQEVSDEEEDAPTDEESDAEVLEEESQEEDETSQIEMEHNGSVFEHPQEPADDADEPYQSASDDEEEEEEHAVYDIDHSSMYEVEHVTAKIPPRDDTVLVKSLADKLKQFVAEREGEQVVESPSPIGIDYAIINNGEQDENSQNGIYLNIHGDFTEAWDKAGLPIFISLDNGATYDIAVSSSTLEILLTKVVNMIKELSED